MKERRTSITVPLVIDNIVFKHMEETGIKTWNAAMFDLVRLGTEYKTVKSSK